MVGQVTMDEDGGLRGDGIATMNSVTITTAYCGDGGSTEMAVAIRFFYFSPFPLSPFSFKTEIKQGDEDED